MKFIDYKDISEIFLRNNCVRNRLPSAITCYVLQTAFCNRVKLNRFPTHSYQLSFTLTHSYPLPPTAIHSTYSHPTQPIIYHSKPNLVPVFYVLTCLTYLCAYVSSCFTFPYAYVIHFYAIYCLRIYIFSMSLYVLICQ